MPRKRPGVRVPSPAPIKNPQKLEDFLVFLEKELTPKAKFGQIRYFGLAAD